MIALSETGQQYVYVTQRLQARDGQNDKSFVGLANTEVEGRRFKSGFWDSKHTGADGAARSSSGS